MAPAARKSIDAQLGDRKFGAQEFGGGNSLRVGRLEHPRFDVMGQRASQLLDFFHTGTPGTNCDFYTDSEATELVNDAARYQHFMREANSPPPSAPDAVRAKEAPYRDVYPEDLHAASLYRWVSGQLNINSVATQFEMESLLRGCFASSDITWNRATTKSAAERPATFVSLGGLVEGDSGKYETPSVLDHGLNTDAADKDLRGPSARPRKTVSDVARKLMLARPFRGPSHLAAAVAQAVGSSDRETALLGDGANSGEGKASALPEWASDAVQEEPFARILNSTTLSSRHFRIYVRGESVVRRPAALNGVLEENIEQVSGRALKVYDVFLQPSRNQGGKIVATQIQILNVRSL
jgi:hypothetical protein